MRRRRTSKSKGYAASKSGHPDTLLVSHTADARHGSASQALKASRQLTPRNPVRAQYPHPEAETRRHPGGPDTLPPQDACRSVIVVFALMPCGQHVHDVLALDLEQQHIPGCAEPDDEFTKKGITRPRLAAAEGRHLEHRHAITDGLQRAIRNCEIAVSALQQPVVKRSRSCCASSVKRTLNGMRHALRAAARRVCNPASTSSADT